MLARQLKVAAFLAVAQLIGFSTARAQNDFEPPEAKKLPSDLQPSDGRFVSISRAESVQIAELYLQHSWKPTEKNIFHGIDANGVRVDTPDVDFQPGDLPGWWVPGMANVSVPYKWGGFSSIEEFDRGIADAKYAGDAWTHARELANGGPASDQAVGVDCSGFLSRCWKLPEHYSTTVLPGLCDLLPVVDALRQGDMMDKPGEHCLLFKEFTNSAKTRAIMYESGSPYAFREASPEVLKVRKVEIDLGEIYELGFRPYRLKWIRD